MSDVRLMVKHSTCPRSIKETAFKSDSCSEVLLGSNSRAVAYERWSVTSGSQCSDLAEKLLVFWKTGR